MTNEGVPARLAAIRLWMTLSLMAAVGYDGLFPGI